MKTTKATNPLAKPLAKIRELTSSHRVILTTHASQRMREREISYASLVHVLQFGRIVPGKYSVDPKTLQEKWCIEGMDPNARNIQVICNVQENLIIITLFEVEK